MPESLSRMIILLLANILNTLNTLDTSHSLHNTDHDQKHKKRTASDYTMQTFIIPIAITLFFLAPDKVSCDD